MGEHVYNVLILSKGMCRMGKNSCYSIMNKQMLGCVLTGPFNQLASVMWILIRGRALQSICTHPSIVKGRGHLLQSLFATSRNSSSAKAHAS